jgi:outer membrane protein TolC
MAVGSTDVGHAQSSVSQLQDNPQPASTNSLKNSEKRPKVSLFTQFKTSVQSSSVIQPSFFVVAQDKRPEAPVKLRALRDQDGDPLPPGAFPLARVASKTTQVRPAPTPSAQTPGNQPGNQPSAPLPNPAGSPTTPQPGVTPAPPAPSAPATPQPSPAPIQNTPPPSTPSPNPSAVPPGKTVPDFVNPSPNPLQFPTRPGEVQIQAVQPITLQQALEFAERNNRDIQIARLQLERNRAAIREARAGNFPTLGLTSSLTRSGDAFITPEAQQSAFEEALGIQPQGGRTTTTSFTTGVELSYDLFTSGLRPAQIQAAERQARSSELQLEQSREAIRLQITSDYYDLQDADQQVLINEAAVRNSEANLRDARAQERAGLGTRFDVLRAEVSLADARQQLTNARSTQNVRRRQLAQRLSIAETVNLVAADPVQQAGGWSLPLEDSIVLAYRNRAELEDQLVQREISEAQIRQARAQNGLTLGVVASYNFQRQGRTNTDTSNTDQYNLALQARLNLFDGGATNARISQRQRDKEIAEARFAQNRNQIRFDVEQAYSNLQANLANIATTEGAVLQAEESLRLAILRFQAGVGTQTERIDAETALTRARGNRVSAIIGYNRSLAQLQRAVSNISR